MTTTINLTDLEKQVLEGINNSDYGSSLGAAVWSSEINCAIAGTRQISGVVSSLSKKGLVTCDGKGLKETVRITPEGIEACKEYNLLGKFAL